MNQQKQTIKIQSLNLIRSHVSIMTDVTAIIPLITNIKIAIIIAVTKNDYHNNNNNNNNSSNDNNNNNNNDNNNKSTNNSNNI